MKWIVFDTEGTGLFQHKNEDGTTRASDAPGQPRMAQFSAVLVDENFEVEETYDTYILPIGWKNADGSPMEVMPEEAFKVHGLSMEFLREHGRTVNSALAVYIRAIHEGRAVLGFNQQHDGRQIRAELRHAGMDDMFEQTPATCAMRSITTNYKGMVKKLNGKGGFPRLIDAAAHFGVPGYGEEKAHNSLEDCLATVAVARELHKLGKLLAPQVHYARDGKPGETV